MATKKKKMRTSLVNNLDSLKSAFIILFTLIIGFIAGFSFSQYYSKKQNNNIVKFPSQAIVTKVKDGDTIKLGPGQSFRLYGISCPEENNPYYQEAKDFTQNKVLNKNVKLEYEENYKEDKLDRLLGYIIIDKQNLNVELVRNGLCKVVIYSKRAKLLYQDQLLEAEEQAKAQGLGVWAE